MGGGVNIARRMTVVPTQLPDPPYPEDIRAKGWMFELDITRARVSNTWVLAPAEIRPWLLMIWACSWERSPCGTLPCDDEVIAAIIGMPMAMFAVHRDILMRGWYRCSDDRLYHPVISELVERMMGSRRKDRDRKAARASSSQAMKTVPCVYCGSTVDLTVDHLLPLVLGGTNDERNLASACRSCNGTKAGRTPGQAGMKILDHGAQLRFEAYMADFDSANKIRKIPPESAGIQKTPEDSSAGTGTGTGTGLISKPSASHPPGGGLQPGFVEFWEAWPKNERKQDKKACAAKWKAKGLEEISEKIVADVRVKRGTIKWKDGFIEAPLVYLNNARWEDGVEPDAPRSASLTTPGESTEDYLKRMAEERRANSVGVVKPPASVTALVSRLKGGPQ